MICRGTRPSGLVDFLLLLDCSTLFPLLIFPTRVFPPEVLKGPSLWMVLLPFGGTLFSIFLFSFLLITFSYIAMGLGECQRSLDVSLVSLIYHLGSCFYYIYSL